MSSPIFAEILSQAVLHLKGERPVLPRWLPAVPIGNQRLGEGVILRKRIVSGRVFSAR